MLVRVKMLGAFRNELKDTELTFPNRVDIAHVMKKLVEGQVQVLERIGGASDWGPFTNSLVLLNGIEINNLEGIKTSVENNDTIVFISVTHGG